MKTITLSKGRIALVDDEDFALLQRHVWCAVKARDGLWYAQTHIGTHTLRMHELVIHRSPRSVIHHEDHNGLNNQKSNLTCTSHANNIRHSLRSKSNTSGFKGVHWDKTNQKWVAGIARKGGHKHIGRFDDKIEAARAYDRAATQRWGEFAMTNEKMGLISPQAN